MDIRDYTVEQSHEGDYYKRMVTAENWIDYKGDELKRWPSRRPGGVGPRPLRYRHLEGIGKRCAHMDHEALRRTESSRVVRQDPQVHRFATRRGTEQPVHDFARTGSPHGGRLRQDGLGASHSGFFANVTDCLTRVRSLVEAVEEREYTHRGITKIPRT